MRMCRTTIVMNFASHKFRATPVHVNGVQVTTNNKKAFCTRIQIFLGPTNKNSPFVLCLRPDNDINEALSPIDACQLIQLK